MDKGFIHKIAVLCKDYYVIRTIDDLFIFAGAERAWQAEAATKSGSERMDNVYGWIAGIEQNAPDQLDKIVAGVATQIAESAQVPEADKIFLWHQINPTGIHHYSAPAVPAKPLDFPKDVNQILERLIKGLPRAMFPLKYRRKDLPSLEFDNEYDVQSLFHVLLRPWIRDIRVEEYTPSYAGTSTRIDFLCAEHEIVVEIKFVRDPRHAKSVGDELVIDIAHYSAHPHCAQLWIVVFDPSGFISNIAGLAADLDGYHTNKSGTVKVRTFVLSL